MATALRRPLLLPTQRHPLHRQPRAPGLLELRVHVRGAEGAAGGVGWLCLPHNICDSYNIPPNTVAWRLRLAATKLAC